MPDAAHDLWESLDEAGRQLLFYAMHRYVDAVDPAHLRSLELDVELRALRF